MPDPREIAKGLTPEHEPIELFEWLRLTGPARVAADIAMSNRRKAATLFADANRLLWEAAELERLARAVHEARKAMEDGDD